MVTLAQGEHCSCGACRILTSAHNVNSDAETVTREVSEYRDADCQAHDELVGTAATFVLRVLGQRLCVLELLCHEELKEGFLRFKHQ